MEVEDYAGAELCQMPGFASGERLLQDVVSSIVREAILKALAVWRPDQPPNDSRCVQYFRRRTSFGMNNRQFGCWNWHGFPVGVRQEFPVRRNAQAASNVLAENLGDLYGHTTLDRNSKDPVQVIVEDVFAIGCTDKAVQITPDQWGGIRTIGGNAN